MRINTVAKLVSKSFDKINVGAIRDPSWIRSFQGQEGKDFEQDRRLWTLHVREPETKQAVLGNK